jgi:hypothetical protein
MLPAPLSLLKGRLKGVYVRHRYTSISATESTIYVGR